ncbi:MAG: hypothetical protein V4531_07755 [Actinomycetota bacterium]
MTDTSTGGRFDPRFNPAFQPGYDPGVHALPPDAPERSVAAAPVENPLPVAQAPSRVSVPAPVTTSVPAESVPADPTDEQAAVRRFDPYLAGLWALSVVFVAAGLLTMRYISDRMDRLSSAAGATAFDYNLVLVYTIAAPLLVTLGLATATGTLFLLAFRRR